MLIYAEKYSTTSSAECHFILSRLIFPPLIINRHVKMIHICVAWMAKGKLRHDVEMILYIETYLATMWLAPALIRNKLAVCLLNKLVLWFTARNTRWVLYIMACTSFLLTKRILFPLKILKSSQLGLTEWDRQMFLMTLVNWAVNSFKKKSSQIHI